MRIYVFYKNGQHNVFEEDNLDCSTLTLRGHASKLVEALGEKKLGIYLIDRYNAVLLDEIVCVRVV